MDGWLCTTCYEHLKRRAAGRRVYKKLGPLTEEQRQLAGSYWRLAAKVACAFRRDHPYSAADFDYGAAIGLFRAATTWTPDRPYRFATAARLDATRGCQVELRLQRAKGKDSPASTVSLEGCDHHEEFLSREGSADELAEKADTIEWMLSPLPERQSRLLRLIFVDGLATEEAGKILGVKKDMSNYLRRKALEALRSDPRLREAAGEPRRASA